MCGLRMAVHVRVTGYPLVRVLRGLAVMVTCGWGTVRGWRRVYTCVGIIHLGQYRETLSDNTWLFNSLVVNSLRCTERWMKL